MIEHKAYACEYCGLEFDEDEREKCLEHEVNCPFKPSLKKCASCYYAQLRYSEGETYIICKQVKFVDHSCGDWQSKVRNNG